MRAMIWTLIVVMVAFGVHQTIAREWMALYSFGLAFELWWYRPRDDGWRPKEWNARYDRAFTNWNKPNRADEGKGE